MIEISSGALAAAINPLGAELSSLRDAEGRELMTDADPAFWTGRAPILFPVVGRVHDDMILVDGTRHPMPRHGFARRSMFDLAAQSPSHARFRLTDSPETHAAYPFAFVLDMDFALEDAMLAMAATITNPADRPLPMSFGWHPAFAWPLPYGGDRAAHRILFDRPEPGALRRITPEGYSTGAVRPSPVRDRVLALDDSLFVEDALVWDPVQSRALSYGTPDRPRLDIDFPDTGRLGIWMKPGARYVCIEPWHGIADPEDFGGEFRLKPGVIEVAPGESWRCEMRVTLSLA